MKKIIIIIFIFFLVVTLTGCVNKKDNTKIEKRDAAKVLEDIGGCSYNMNDSSQTLSLKIGKQ